MSLAEVLVAGVILAVAITGMFSLWNVCDISIMDTAKVNAAGQIARMELERAKVYGPSNFPAGTISNCTSGASTWTGDISQSTSKWVSAGTSYYDYKGALLSSSTGAAFSAQVTVTDTGDLVPSPCTAGTSTGTVATTTQRFAVVSVKRMSDKTVLFTSGTEMVEGGI